MERNDQGDCMCIFTGRLGNSKPIGDDNDRWLVACAREAGIIVAAWGVNGEHMGRDEEVLKLLDGVECLRITKAGHPEHPLYVPYEVATKTYEGRTGNAEVSEGGTRDSRIETAAQSRPSLH